MNVYIKKYEHEKYSSKTNKSWYVIKYQLIDENGTVLIHPYFDTRKEAKEAALKKGWNLIK